jgi:ketoreductase RED1
MKFDDVAVVGAGTIEISWTALFLAHGARVRLFDVRPDIHEYVMSNLEQIAPTMSALGLPTQTLTHRLEISGSLDRAVTGAQVIQDTAVSQFPTEHRNRGCITRVVEGQVEIAGRRPVAIQRPEPADARVRTMRQP